MDRARFMGYVLRTRSARAGETIFRIEILHL